VTPLRKDAVGVWTRATIILNCIRTIIGKEGRYARPNEPEDPENL
jgi:hypothetical protein